MDFRYLGQTINDVNESILFGVPISDSDAARVSRFIASRQGLPGSYCGLFAPMDGELTLPYRVFTGEVTTTSAAGRHIIGEESLRILRILDCREPEVLEAIGRAQERFLRQLDETEKTGYGTGTYCCGKCTIAYWRTLMTHWLPDAEERIQKGIGDLKKSRFNGKWRRYPFYYTLQCLCELPLDLAGPEIKYIQPICETTLRHIRKSNAYYRQRCTILNNVLTSV